jgi:membrane protease YdiL (CAAX protease family)
VTEGDQSGGTSLPRPALALVAILYVAAVLSADTLAAHGVSTPFEWRVLHSNFEMDAIESVTGSRPAREWAQFDSFKFLAWFIVPLALSLFTIDFGYFGVKRWKRVDLIILGVLIVLGIGAVLLIPLFPSLDRLYGGLGDRSAEMRSSYAIGNLLWMFSWLIGWEFLHRYFLLRNIDGVFGKYSWLLVPLSEFIYHLQKPLPEALLAGGGGVVLTYWALKRRNVLLPFLAHLSIELALLVYLLLN